MSEQYEYFNNSVPKEIIQQKVDSINYRWKELYELEVKYGDDAMKYLFYVNAGGAAAVLAFIGTSSPAIGNLCSIKFSLILFAVGLILDGLLIAFQLHRAGSIFDQWRNDANAYYNQQKKYSELINADDDRSDRSKMAFVLGYFSLGAFILGLIFGGVALF